MLPYASSQHPEYTHYYSDWLLMRDSYEGQRRIKQREEQYLSPTQNMRLDGMQGNQLGRQAYNAYLQKAYYPGNVRESVQTAVGLLHSKPANITLPPRLENIRSSKGETMDQLLRRINQEQLVTGRLGLLLDLPSDPQPTEIPYIALYKAEQIVNWDDGNMQESVPQRLELVVLDETEYVRHGTTWQQDIRSRVLTLGSVEPNTFGDYRFALFNHTVSDVSDDDFTTVTYRGRSLPKIPFVIINSLDLVPEVDRPPLLDLANQCLQIYRKTADYNQSLFLQSQDTLVIKGVSPSSDDDGPLRVGAGSRIELSPDGDAKYIGVDSKSLPEQRLALENDFTMANAMGAQLFDTVSRERESGSSLSIRIAARTANLPRIAMTAAAGLESILKTAAEWVGDDPELVSVEPNLDLSSKALSGQEMMEISAAKANGFPVSQRSIHDHARKLGWTNRTFEEEMALIESETYEPINADRNPQQ